MNIYTSPFFNQIKNKIKALQKVNTSVGTVVYDVFIAPTVYINQKLATLNEFYKRLQTPYSIKLLLEDSTFKQQILDDLEITEADFQNIVDNAITIYAQNFNITKLPATKSSGIIYLMFDQAYPNGITIPTTFQVQSSATKLTFTYTAKEEKTVIPVFNYDVSKYVIELAVTCDTEGTAGNLDAWEIDTPITRINGLIGIGNPFDFTNGTDEESTENFLDRLISQFTSKFSYSKNGIKNFLLESNLCRDVYVATSQDVLMKRNKYGGAADCWVITNKPLQVTEPGTLINSWSDNQGVHYQYKLNFAPIIINSDSSINVTIIYTDTTSETINDLNNLPVNVEKVQLDNSEYKYSIKEQNIIQTKKEVKSFIYFYDENIASLQNLVDENTIYGVELLVRKAIPVYVNIGTTIYPKTGFTKEQVINTLKIDIENYINKLKLGEMLAESDIVDVMENNTMVQYVTVPFNIFCKDGENGNPTGEITIKNNEYLQVTSDRITLI